MKILIIGYGKMGHEIESISKNKGHKISGIATNFRELMDLLGRANAHDIAVEFTNPDSAYSNTRACIENGIPVVSGTTGWNEKMPELKVLVEEKGGSFFHTPNFSIGMNLVFHLTEIMGGAFSHLKNYSAEISETHHLNKLDKPSGTAIKMAQEFLNKNELLKEWKLDSSKSGILSLKSDRREGVVGTHKLILDSELETISLEHMAKDRRVFADGAIKAAEFLVGKRGSYSMKDLLGF